MTRARACINISTTLLAIDLDIAPTTTKTISNTSLSHIHSSRETTLALAATPTLYLFRGGNPLRTEGPVVPSSED